MYSLLALLSLLHLYTYLNAFYCYRATSILFNLYIRQLPSQTYRYPIEVLIVHVVLYIQAHVVTQ